MEKKDIWGGGGGGGGGGGEEYHMAGNFRGVLIFVIFVVDLAVTKFSHPRKLMPTAR